MTPGLTSKNHGIFQTYGGSAVAIFSAAVEEYGGEHPTTCRVSTKGVLDLATIPQ